MMKLGSAPKARSPSTKGLFFKRRTSPLTTRENPVHEVATIAMSILTNPGSKIPAKAIIRLKLGTP